MISQFQVESGRANITVQLSDDLSEDAGFIVVHIVEGMLHASRVTAPVSLDGTHGHAIAAAIFDNFRVVAYGPYKVYRFGTHFSSCWLMSIDKLQYYFASHIRHRDELPRVKDLTYKETVLTRQFQGIKPSLTLTQELARSIQKFGVKAYEDYHYSVPVRIKDGGKDESIGAQTSAH